MVMIYRHCCGELDGFRLNGRLRLLVSFALDFRRFTMRESCIVISNLPTSLLIQNGKARITDFGIAGVEAEIAKDNLRVGTPAYMSPEQITGKDISAKSDI